MTLTHQDIRVISQGYLSSKGREGEGPSLIQLLLDVAEDSVQSMATMGR